MGLCARFVRSAEVRWEFVAACAFRRASWRCGVLDCRDVVGRGVGVCRGVFWAREEAFWGCISSM